MKVLIEIDETLIEKTIWLDVNNLDTEDLELMRYAISNGTPLNGTNGEVFEKIMGYMSMDDAYITTDRRGYLHLRGVKEDWWNADYKGVE